MKSAPWPIAVRTVDLGAPLASLDGLARYARVRIIVSQGRELIGSVDLDTNGADIVAAERLRDVIVRELGLEVFEHRLTAALLQRLPATRLRSYPAAIAKRIFAAA
jgi:hypothetical protein